MFEKNIRPIAIQAIAARATGSPVEAAKQILQGIAVYDAGTEQPVVVLWPEKLQESNALLERAAWHESERDRLVAQEASNRQASAAFWAGIVAKGVESAPLDQPSSLKASDHQSVSEPDQPRHSTAVLRESAGEEFQEARPPSSDEPR